MDDAELGTCRACGQELIKYQGDIWHPHTVQNHCPASQGTMRPGEENFVANPKPVCSWCHEEIKPGEKRVGWHTKDGADQVTDKGTFHLTHLFGYEKDEEHGVSNQGGS